MSDKALMPYLNQVSIVKSPVPNVKSLLVVWRRPPLRWIDPEVTLRGVDLCAVNSLVFVTEVNGEVDGVNPEV